MKIFQQFVHISVQLCTIRFFTEARETFIIDCENKDPTSKGNRWTISFSKQMPFQFCTITVSHSDVQFCWLMCFLKLCFRDIALTASCLEYEPTIPAKFMIGTDQVDDKRLTKMILIQNSFAGQGTWLHQESKSPMWIHTVQVTASPLKYLVFLQCMQNLLYMLQQCYICTEGHF